MASPLTYSKPSKGGVVSSITALAEALGMSRGSLQNLVRRGIVRPTKRNGSYEVMRVYGVLERYSAKMEGKGRASEGAQLMGLELQKERNYKATADMKELQLAISKRKLIHTDTVIELLLRIGAVIGQRFSNLNNTIPIECDGMATADIQRILGEKLEIAAKSVNDQISAETVMLTVAERDQTGRVDTDA